MVESDKAESFFGTFLLRVTNACKLELGKILDIEIVRKGLNHQANLIECLHHNNTFLSNAKKESLISLLQHLKSNTAQS